MTNAMTLKLYQGELKVQNFGKFTKKKYDLHR